VKMKKFMLTTVSLAALAALIFGAYKFITLMAETINPTVTVAVLTMMGSAASLSLGKYIEKSREIEKEIREKKIPIYSEFIDFLFRVLRMSKEGNDMDEAEMIAFMLKFNQTLMVWGSDEVMRAWIQFRTLSTADDSPGKALKIAKSIASIILAIRSDIGHSNVNIDERGILSTFINDIDDFYR
jgi:hypothetical protein